MDWLAVGAGCGCLGAFLLVVTVLRARMEMAR